MKALLISALAIILVSSIVPSSPYELTKASAEVEMIEGVYVFVNAAPLMEYEYLGTIDGGTAILPRSEQYTEVRDRLIKRAKKKYPNADGLIFSFRTGQKDKADVIQFK